jgi:hypothetical protein
MAAWQFAPLPRRIDPIQERAFEARRRAAVLSAHGLGTTFDLHWETGPHGRILLEPASPDGARWLARVLFPLYGTAAWRYVSPSLESEWICRAVGSGAPLASTPAATVPGAWSESIVAALPTLPPGWRILWRFTPAGVPAAARSRPEERSGQIVPPGVRLDPPPSIESDQRDLVAARRHEPWWYVRCVVEERGASAGPSLAAALARLVRSATQTGGSLGIRLGTVSRWRPRRWTRLWLATSELANLLPALAGIGPGVAGAESTPNSSMVVGHDTAGMPVRLPWEPHQGRHLAVLGETGMGKSTALVRVAVAAAALGSVVLLDPIGETGRRLVAQLPSAALDRVIWVSPTESPVGINVLESLRGDRLGTDGADRALSDLVDALRRVRAARYAESAFWGPRIEETVRLALATAAAIPGATVLDAARLLEAATGRRHGLPAAAQASAERLWARVRDRPEELEGSRRLLAELTDRPALVRLLAASHPRSSVGDWLGGRRIVVLSGEAPAIGEVAARYLLATYLALLWSERLASRSADKQVLLLDEAQWYAHETLGEMLRLGRRTNLHVVVATQSLRSLAEPVREAVLTNCADLLCFRTGPDDAREVARWSGAADPERFAFLPRGLGVLLLGKGQGANTWSVSPPPGGDHVRAEPWDRVLEHSRPYWTEPDGAMDSGASSGSQLTPSPRNRDWTPEERAVLLTLWAGFLALPESAELEVDLAAVRAATDPEGQVLRSVGRHLSAVGAIAPGAGAGRWRVLRVELRRQLGTGVDPAELAAATERWSRYQAIRRGSPAAQAS